MPKENHSYKVHFLPHDREVAVEEGTTLLEAAHEANVYISSICGGVATCGKCKVVVEEGHVESSPTSLLSSEELANNYVLACQARVMGDLLISVPPETRMEGGKILLSSEETLGVTAGKVHGLLPGVEYRHEPLVRKVYLELTPPTIDDNLPDYERLKRALMLKAGIPMESLEAGLEILKELPKTLRKEDWRITATTAQWGTVQELIRLEPGDTTLADWGLAVDVGTTTVVAELVNLATAKVLDIEATYNSQMKWGEDYIQRIMYATERNALEDMQRSVVKDINGLLSILLTRNHLNPEEVTAIICSGNTAMIHFLLALDPTLIRKEPYIATANFIPTLKAHELGIKIYKHAPLYCLPSVAAYVGGDITGGAMAIGLDQQEEICLFIDIGTNGEVVLGNKEWMVCCSASAGPSFEGSGVRHGMRAASGAVERLDITEDFSLKIKIIGDGSPRGICGSGLLDTIAALLRSGAINKSGKLMKGTTQRIRETEEGLEFLITEAAQTATGSDIVITQADIQNLIRSKAAVYSAVATLLEAMHLQPSDIRKVYLAGGFGNYLDVRNTITIGMLPEIPADRIRFVGNSSLAGVRLSLLSQDALSKVKEVASKMTYFDLMSNPKYMDEFISANFLPHTDPKEFPSVYQELASRHPSFN
jgi:uncharacterized 2Fe-2S/4Fe-4S cluster protein (DUF4445 family)